MASARTLAVQTQKRRSLLISQPDVGHAILFEIGPRPKERERERDVYLYINIHVHIHI